MRSKTFIALFIVTVTGLIGYMTYLAPPAPTTTRHTQPQTTTPQTPKTNPNPTRNQQPQTRENLYRCNINGRTVYQDQPCQNDQQTAITGGTISVVPRYPVEAAKRAIQAIERPLPKRQVAQAEPENIEPKGEHSECAYLRARVREIDARARQRSTQALTDARRHARDRMSSLKCSYMD